MARIRQKTIQYPGIDNEYTFADEADLFNAEEPWVVGDYCICAGDLYRCTTDHTGSWNSEHFTAVKTGDELKALNGAISNRVKIVNDKASGLNTLDNIVNYALAQIANGNARYGETFTFRTNNGSGTDPDEYFTNSRVVVICNFQQSTYGCGLLLSDNPKNIAAFMRRADVNTLYPIGDFQGAINNLAEVRAKLGAKNLLPYPFLDTTQTIQGITVTDNGDGSLTLNGTRTGTGTVFFNLSNYDFGTTAIRNDTPPPINSKYRCVVLGGITNSIVQYNPGNHVTSLNIWENASFDNVTIYPMIMLYEDTQTDTFEEYAKTNIELTKNVSNLNAAINNTNLQVTPYIETGTKATRGYSAGQFLIWNNLLYIVASQISLGDTFTAGTNILQTYIVGRFLPTQYYSGEYIMFNGAELGLSAANNLVNVIIRTERQIPSNITITPHLTVGWIRYNGTTDDNVEFVSAGRNTANSFIVTVRATNGISAGNVCGVFLQGDIALS